MNKIPELKIHLAEINPDIVCITESWLHADISDSVLGLNDYRIFRKDRNNGVGGHGGVLIAVKPNLNPASRKGQDSEHDEILYVDIIIKNEPHRIVCAYRALSQSLAENESFITHLKRNLESTRRFTLVGDLNYPDIDWSDYHTRHNYAQVFLDFVNENHLIQWVDKPTRESNILDICLSSDPRGIKNLVVHPTFSTSDHSYITCEIDSVNYKSEPNSFYDFRSANWDGIHNHLAAVDWTTLFYDCDASRMWSRFKTLVRSITEDYVPVKTFVHYGKTPWTTREMLDAIKKKENLWKIMKENPSTQRPTQASL